MSTQHSRRQFIKTALIAASASTLNMSAQEDRTPLIIGFSKPFLKSSPQEAADIVKEIGWGGIECPVRARGQVEPARIEEDLPKFVETFKNNGLQIPIISTDIDRATDPTGLKVLQTAAKLGIKKYRLKHFYYDLKKEIPPQLEEWKIKMRDLAQLNAELGIQGGIQNHSGSRYIGAPLWDLYFLVKDLDPKHMGVCFDIGHATVEGGYSWPIEAKLLKPWLTAIFVKDFTWKKTEKGWTADWCPLGDGMVNKDFFKNSGGALISQHHEYKLGDRANMIKAMQKDLRVLKDWL